LLSQIGFESGSQEKERGRGGHLGFPISQKSEKMNLLDLSDLKIYLLPFIPKNVKIKPFLFIFLQSSLSRKYNACFVES